MSETQSLDRSFRGWYGRTIGKRWIITQAAAWEIFGGAVLIPAAYGLWRFFVWADDWQKTNGKEAAARFDATHTWVEPTVTKRGRLRRGYWQRK